MTEQLSDDDLAAMFQRCSNAGRWGPHDEQGHAQLHHARQTPCRGGAGPDQRNRVGGPPVVNAADEDDSASGQPYHGCIRPGRGVSGDWFSVASHGMTVTHMDALAHFSWEDQLYRAFLTSRGEPTPVRFAHA